MNFYEAVEAVIKGNGGIKAFRESYSENIYSDRKTITTILTLDVYPDDEMIHHKFLDIKNDSGNEDYLSVEDLLATDWEIVCKEES